MTARRALILCDVTCHGGVSIYLAQVWRAAMTFGWDATLVLDDNAGANAVEAYLTAASVPVTRWPIRMGDRDETAITLSINQLLSAATPKVVHAVLGSPRSLLAARERTIAAAIPLVFTEQYVSSDLVIPDAKLGRLQAIHAQAAAIVYVSDENRRCAAQHLDLASLTSLVIPNAIERSPQQIMHRKPPSRLLTVARLTRQKGLDILLDAMTMVRPHATLRIVGDGESRADLMAQAARLGFESPRVEFGGWTSEVAAEFIEADLFVLPSRAEGQPFALLEAMAVGLPAITTNVSGIPEALDQGECGVLIPTEDANALASAINAFLDDPTEGRHRAGLARARVEHHFEISTNSVKLMQVWERVAKRSAS